jgi:hypothetical protein
MNPGGACEGDMPITAQGDIPRMGDPAFDALLDRSLGPEDTPAGLRPLAEGLAALETAELRSRPGAEASALAAFRSGVGRSAAPARRRPRRHPLIARLLTARAAAATAAAAVVLGGTAAAAMADKLPAPAQKVAHDVIGAPSTPAGHPTHTASPQASSLPGHSAFGLCTAWANAKTSGNATQKAVAFQRLEVAAGGAAKVSSFCASVTHPGSGSAAKRSTHQTGKPSAQPSAAQGHPNGKPSTEPSPAQSHRDGKPSTLPSPAQSHPAGQPSDAPVG